MTILNVSFIYPELETEKVNFGLAFIVVSVHKHDRYKGLYSALI